MNPSTALARVLVDELVRAGVCEAVLSPGSRSAPLAMALHAADVSGRLRLHVRVDERVAGFVALGLAKGSRRPVAVLTTSGTAVVNLHPAVLEARHAGVPLLVLTADRPGELRGTGANQTTDQVKVFGSGVVWSAELPAPELVPPSAASWRSVVSRAAAAASRAPGPVHLNIGLREPLLAEPGTTSPSEPQAGLPAALAGRADGAPWTAVPPLPVGQPAELPLGPRTVVVAGDEAGPAARLLAEAAGWPLLAEPTSGSRTGSSPVGTYRLLLGQLGRRAERVVVYGRPTLSRPTSQLLARSDVELVVVADRAEWTDAGSRAALVVPALCVPGRDHTAWRDTWRAADRLATRAVEQMLADEPMGGLHVAREVSAALPAGGLLFVGASQPARDLDLVATAYPVGGRRRVTANRGLSGIDGAVSTAVGLALARDSTRALALLGDLTFLHDRNGLLLGPDEPRPDVTLVIVNDDGGAIFSLLEQGAPEHAAGFERVFGTPTGADLAATCASTGVPHRRVGDLAGLRAALASPGPGVEVVEVRVDRTGRREMDRRLQDAVAAAVNG